MDYSSWALHGLDQTFSTIRSQEEGLGRADLDSEYAKMSVEIVRHLRLLAPQPASIVSAWLERLNTSDNICLIHASCQRHGNAWRMSRNSLARALVIGLRDGALQDPFDSLPELDVLVPPAIHCSDRLSSRLPACNLVSRMSTTESFRSPDASISRISSAKVSLDSTFRSQGAAYSDSLAMRALREPVQGLPDRSDSVPTDTDELSDLTLQGAAEAHARYRTALSRQGSACSSPAPPSGPRSPAEALPNPRRSRMEADAIASEYRELANRDSFRTLGAISRAGLGPRTLGVSSRA